MTTFPSDDIIRSVWSELDRTAEDMHLKMRPFQKHIEGFCAHCDFFGVALSKSAALPEAIAQVAVPSFGSRRAALYGDAIVQIGIMLFYLGYKVRERELSAASLERLVGSET